MVTQLPMNAVLPSLQPEAPATTIEMLNSACFCFSLDEKALARALDQAGNVGDHEALFMAHAHGRATTPMVRSACGAKWSKQAKEHLLSL